MNGGPGGIGHRRLARGWSLWLPALLRCPFGRGNPADAALISELHGLAAAGP